MKTFSHLSQYLSQFFLEWEMFQIKVVEKIKIHILCSITFFSEYRAVYEIMSTNMVGPERPQMAIWLRVGCWISKATRARTHTHTHTHRNIHYLFLMAFPCQQWFRERASVLRYTYIACLVARWNTAVILTFAAESYWVTVLYSIEWGPEPPASCRPSRRDPKLAGRLGRGTQFDI